MLIFFFRCSWDNLQDPGSKTPLEILRLLFRDDAAQFNPNQEEAVTAALLRKENFVVCLPTGGGKSLVYLLPAFYEQGRWTLVMCPNAALLRDQMHKAEKLGLKCTAWRSKSGRIPDETQIIYVALETTTSSNFKRCASGSRRLLCFISHFCAAWLSSAHHVSTGSCTTRSTASGRRSSGRIFPCWRR